VTEPVVSVLLPVWNGERFLAEAIESVLGQTLGDFELVVVDDGSTDRSTEIVRGYADDRIRIVSQEHKGLVEALNHGLAESRARYVARMDADDVSLPRRLERQIDFLDRHRDTALVGCAFAVIDDAGRELRTVYLLPDDSGLRRRLLLGNPFAHGSIAAQREVLIAAGGYRAHYGRNEDYDLWRRLLPTRRVAALPEVLYRYREHASGLSRTDAGERIGARERLRDELWGTFGGEGPNLREVVRAGGRYRRDATAPPGTAFRLYLEDQWALAHESFRRGHARRGAELALAATILDPGSLVSRLGRLVRRPKANA
jgi:glycosyltransferase involved in cell wall biosynthesis